MIEMMQYYMYHFFCSFWPLCTSCGLCGKLWMEKYPKPACKSPLVTPDYCVEHISSHWTCCIVQMFCHNALKTQNMAVKEIMFNIAHDCVACFLCISDNCRSQHQHDKCESTIDDVQNMHQELAIEELVVGPAWRGHKAGKIDESLHPFNSWRRKHRPLLNGGGHYAFRRIWMHLSQFLTKKKKGTTTTLIAQWI